MQISRISIIWPQLTFPDSESIWLLLSPEWVSDHWGIFRLCKSVRAESGSSPAPPYLTSWSSFPTLFHLHNEDLGSSMGLWGLFGSEILKEWKEHKPRPELYVGWEDKSGGRFLREKFRKWGLSCRGTRIKREDLEKLQSWRSQVSASYTGDTLKSPGELYKMLKPGPHLPEILI